MTLGSHGAQSHCLGCLVTWNQGLDLAVGQDYWLDVLPKQGWKMGFWQLELYGQASFSHGNGRL